MFIRSVILIVALLAIISLSAEGKPPKRPKGPRPPKKPKRLKLGIADRPFVAEFDNAAVATDSVPCSTVGARILRKGGSAVDAAVASSFCVGVFNLHSAGIGGGGFLIYYNATSKSSAMIDFREVAASGITDETMKIYKEDETSTVTGGLAVGVCGQVRGLHEAWRRFGRLPWRDLVRPAIKLAKKGFKVTKAIEKAIDAEKDTLESDKDRFRELRNTLRDLEGNYLREGDTLIQPKLAKTLRKIAKSGPEYFYSSRFTERLVKFLQEDRSVLTADDFKNYEIKIRDVVSTKYHDFTLHGASLPAGGPVMGLIFNILEGFDLSEESIKDDEQAILTYHRIIEAYKFAYGQRLLLGDPDFSEEAREVSEYMLDPQTAIEMRENITDDKTHDPSYYSDELENNPSDDGTTHITVYAENGDAVVTTQTINTYFGSKLSFRGVILNNQMGDFSVPGRDNPYGYPPTPANYIKPGSRPLSSTTPTIVLKDGKVVVAAGASGGSKIPTSVSQIILDLIAFNKPLKESSPAPRLHHQLLPNVLQYEEGFSAAVIEGLKGKGHKVEKSSTAVVQAIHVKDEKVHAASDVRKGGKPDGY